MDIPNPFKAQKLKITSLDNPSNVFEAMFNPSQYAITRQVKWKTLNTNTPNNGSAPSDGTPTNDPNATTPQPQFDGLEYGSFAVKLILDGTGASDFGLTTGFGLAAPTVKEKVAKFMLTCYNVNERTHSTPRVQIKWGGLEFKGYLERVTINYTLFDTSGNALRAELDTSFKMEPADVKLSSPDLTHTREVHEGDTLPLMSKEIYGSSRYYLLIAEANKLDDFRNLKAGTKLYFPPLDN